MALDNITKRALIVDLRDNAGMSFDGIAAALQERYGYRTTRQAVFAVYHRAKSADARKNAKATREYTLGMQAVNFAVRGYTMDEIGREPEKYGLPDDATAARLRQAMARLGQPERAMERTRNVLVKTLKTDILLGKTHAEMFPSVSYNGFAPKPKIFTKLLSEAHYQILQDMTTDYLKKEYTQNEDKELMRAVLHMLPFDISLQSVCQETSTEGVIML